MRRRLNRAFSFMQKIGFVEALDSIVANDPRYQRDAYIFLRDALDFTTKQQKKVKGTTVRHVSGPELLHGVRQYALKEFGPIFRKHSPSLLPRRNQLHHLRPAYLRRRQYDRRFGARDAVFHSIIEHG
jgi:hypothetical protein